MKIKRLSNKAVDKLAKQEWKNSLFPFCQVEPKDAFMEAFMLGFACGEQSILKQLTDAKEPSE